MTNHQQIKSGDFAGIQKQSVALNSFQGLSENIRC